MKSFINFEGQVAFITGTGSPTGIGFNVAKILGSLGAKIALVDTTNRIQERENDLKEMGVECKSYIADLMDREQVRNLISNIISDFGKIDVLVNNAGMVTVGVEEDFSGFVDVSYDSWDTTISRNLGIMINVTKEVLPYMVEAGYGRIVNTSSVTGPVVSNPGEAAYGAAKAAILGASRSIAIEFGSKGICINSVLPGWIGTASQTEAEAAGGYNTPARRSADPVEVANGIVFLASKEASYINGEYLVIDGGNTIQEYKGPSELYY